MLFNTNSFFIFFFVVITAYFLLPFKWRSLLLLAASYYFYMCWKTEYIILIVVSTLIDYYCALKMSQFTERNNRKIYLSISVFSNLAMLFAFKYMNFFSETLQTAINIFGFDYSAPMLAVILPVGISFYTFQTMSYSIDVYYDRMKPERNIIDFALYVSFFPQLVAGPIERASTLLPQFKKEHVFDYTRIRNGLLLMLWGLLKKVVIADRLIEYVNVVYSSTEDHFGLQVWIATFFYYVQLYCDFSGYTDIALGAAAVMGFTLIQNFRRPFFSTSIKDFWNRWHISLSTWFRDYVYIPLGGNRKGARRNYINIMIVFLSTGFWHGANWTYLLFGFSHAALIISNLTLRPYIVSVKSFIGLDRLPGFHKALNIFYTLIIFSGTLLIFRSNTVADALTLFRNAFDFSSGSGVLNLFQYQADLYISLIFIALILLIEAYKEFGNEDLSIVNMPKALKWSLFIGAILCIMILGKFKAQDFIYFQF